MGRKKIDDGLTPQARWSEKNQYITKEFKMYKSTADKFKEACKTAGVSQSGKIIELMEQFISEVEKDNT